MARRPTYSRADTANEPGFTTQFATNIIPFAEPKFTDWSPFTAGDGAINIASDGHSVTFTGSTSGARAWLSFNMDTTSAVTYCFGCRVTAASGVSGMTQDSISTGDTPSAGDAAVPITSTGRWCIIWTSPGSTTPAMRIGLGTLTGISAGAKSITVDQPFIYQVASVSTAPPDFGPIGTSAYRYANGNSVASGGGLITQALGSALIVPTYACGVAVGDSFGNDIGEFPTLIQSYLNGQCIHVDSVSGRTLATVDTIIDDALTLDTLPTALARPKFAIAYTGVNDVINDATLAQMQARATNIVAKCKARSCIPILSTVAPFGQNASWSSGRETVRVGYNAWLKASKTPIWNISELLEDKADKTQLDSAYYAGGGDLHPNSTGQTLIARGLSGVIANLPKLQGVIANGLVPGIVSDIAY